MNTRLRLSSLPAPLVAVALLVTGALAAPTSAVAGPPSPREIHREVTGHLLDVLDGVHDVLRVLDPIPLLLEPLHRGELEVYFGGQQYYGPHRHYHSVYNFPVDLGGVVVYRPHYYCNSQLFGGYDYYPRHGVRYRSRDSYRDYRSFPSYGQRQDTRDPWRHGGGYDRDNRRPDSRRYDNRRYENRPDASRWHDNRRNDDRWRNDQGRGHRDAPGRDSGQRNRGDRNDGRRQSHDGHRR